MSKNQNPPAPGFVEPQPLLAQPPPPVGASAPPPPYPAGPPMQYPQQPVHMQPVQMQPVHTMPIQPVQMYTIQALPPMLGRYSTRMMCPSCHAEILTSVHYQTSQKTHLIALLMCLFTGCCCLPYCFDVCKTANHYCPNCNSYLGAHADNLL